MPQTIVVLDFGSQYTQVIARRIREANVYSCVLPYDSKISEVRKHNPVGIVLSGGPASVFAKSSPKPNPQIFKLNIPILGICYGLQLMGKMLGGEVKSSDRREYGRGTLKIERKGTLFSGLPAKLSVWNSHGDSLAKLPKGFRILAKTENSSFAAIEDPKRKFYGLQFHPEVEHSEKGSEIILNFLKRVCGCKGDWDMGDFLESSISEIRKKVGDEKVILGLSGGVDSSVAAALIDRAIGKQLTCIFVDNGLLRLNEREEVKKLFKDHIPGKLKVSLAGPLFLKRLRGVTNPETKRKIIGKTFIEVFDKEVKNLGDVDYLAQGTLYPDVIESVPIGGNPAALIKSHHNVGGLPKKMNLKLVEPLKFLFKDEVRKLGLELKLSKEIISRHPFPGPGLAIRMPGIITNEKIKILKEADYYFIQALKDHGLYHKIWQAYAALLPVKTVGVMGDNRTYEYLCLLRAITSEDGMTADYYEFKKSFMQSISNKIVNSIRGINRVVYDVTSKPPSTIELE